MRRLSFFGFHVAVVALTVLACGSFVQHAYAQTTGTNGTTGTAGTTGTTANGGAPQAGGVAIDPQGVLRTVYSDPRTTMMRLQAAKQALPQHLAKPSKLRKISLNRLEVEVSKLVAAGGRPSAEMVALAGLTRIEYVFFYPETGDIVLAGPAEGFAHDAVGRLVGIESGKPCILLDDLIVALRAYAPSEKKTKTISVSIDPTQEGLARMQDTLNILGGNFRSAADIPIIVNSLRTALGLNEVTITGIPAGTHFAHVLTEADYRMKLIGIGLEPPPVPMATYISKMTASMTSSNALVRWFFVPDYEAIAESQDGLGMKLVGQGVKLVGEDELVSSDGSRKASGRQANPASRAFTTDFTKKFRMISENNLVYSQLRNLVDLTIVAAYIQERDFYGQAGWDLGIFVNEDQLPVEVLPAPRQVETAINAVIKGSRLITPIGGGVQIQAIRALDEKNLQSDSNGEVKKSRTELQLLDIRPEQWWWD